MPVSKRVLYTVRIMSQPVLRWPVNFDRFPGTSPSAPSVGAKKGGTNGVKRKRRSGSGRSQSRSATTLEGAHSLSHGNASSVRVDAKDEKCSGLAKRVLHRAHSNSKDFVTPPNSDKVPRSLVSLAGELTVDAREKAPA